MELPTCVGWHDTQKLPQTWYYCPMWSTIIGLSSCLEAAWSLCICSFDLSGLVCMIWLISSHKWAMRLLFLLWQYIVALTKWSRSRAIRLFATAAALFQSYTSAIDRQQLVLPIVLLRVAAQMFQIKRFVPSLVSRGLRNRPKRARCGKIFLTPGLMLILLLPTLKPYTWFMLASRHHLQLALVLYRRGLLYQSTWN